MNEQIAPPASETGPGVAGELRGTVIISIGQAALMVVGGVIALLITQYFGKGAETDAFFTSYGFYTIAVALAQGLRLTALPHLLAAKAGGDGSREDSRMLAAAGGIALLALVPMVVFAGPFGELIANGDPTGTAAETMRLLWPALAMHLLAGIFVPMLTIRGVYAHVGASLIASSVVSVVAVVALQDSAGIDAVPIGLSLSAFALAAMLAVRLWLTGWRPAARAFTKLAAISRDTWLLLVSSATFLVVNFGYLICLAVANRIGTGSATLYAYGFFAAAFLVGTTAIPGAMVRAPRLLGAAGERRLEPGDIIAEYRVAIVLIAAALGLAGALTEPLIGAIAPDFFSSDDAFDLIWVLYALIPWVLASVAGVVVLLELLNRGRANLLAVVAVVQCILLVPLAIAGKQAGGIVGIALAQSLAMTGATLYQLRVAFGKRYGEALGALGAATARAAGIAVVSFGPAVAAAVAESGLALVAVLAVTGCAVYALLARLAFAAEAKALIGLALRR